MYAACRKQLFPILFLLVVAVCACASAEEVSFYVATVFPENQTNPDLGVYDLMMRPEQEQRLEVLVVNEGDTPLRVNVGAYGGYTTNTGMIYYSADAPVETANPPPARFGDMVKPTAETVAIEPYSQASCMLDIKMPPEPYDGVVHGAVVITQVLEDSDQEDAASMRIRNRIQYALGIRLRTTEEKVQPAFAMDGAKMNAENRLELTIRNAAAVMGMPMGMEIDVVSKDGGETVFSYALPSFSMAANSTMHYAVPNFDGNEQIPPGQYIVNVRLAFEKNTYDLSASLAVNE